MDCCTHWDVWDMCACGHFLMLHDIEDLEDLFPTCCVDGCDQTLCPKPPPAGEPVTMARISPEDLNAIPVEHRRVIARWICERADGIKPSMFCTPSEAEAIGGVLYGAAVDLADPISDDSSVQHARDVLATLDVKVV